jgi:spermidine synthase
MSGRRVEWKCKRKCFSSHPRKPAVEIKEILNTNSGAYFVATSRLAGVTSAYQHIEVFDTPELGRLMRIDGVNMVSERDEFFYHESLIHPVAITHANPRQALIVGGGDGGAAEELLKHPTIECVTLCELDGQVVEVAKQYFESVHQNVFEDVRCNLVIGDGLAYVQNSQTRYDLIYLDLTDPIGAAEALYTQTFYGDCARALMLGGALTLHLGSPFSHPERVRLTLQNLRAVFRYVAPYFVHIPMYGATWGFARATQSRAPTEPTGAEIDARLTERNIQHRQFYTGATHHAMHAIPPYIAALIE